jgi:hypothetical protein
MAFVGILCAVWWCSLENWKWRQLRSRFCFSEKSQALREEGQSAI